MSKGGAYEREFCQMLSLWWSGDRDDLFWRSAGSGARAKVRGRKGITTHGQHGDICATDPSGDPLTRLLTIELKRGYSKTAIGDFLDNKVAYRNLSEFFAQVIESHRQAGSFSWLLVLRRDHRQAVAFFPDVLHKSLTSQGCFTPRPIPMLRMDVLVNLDGSDETHRIHGLALQNFLECVTPRTLKAMARKLKD